MRAKEKKQQAQESVLTDDVYEDRIRMDWLAEAVKNGKITIKGMNVYDYETLREAVDAAIKEE